MAGMDQKELAAKAFTLLLTDVSEDLELAHQLRTGGRPVDTSRTRRTLLRLLGGQRSNAGNITDARDPNPAQMLELPEPDDIPGVSPEFRATVEMLSDTDRMLLRVALDRLLRLLQLEREVAAKDAANETARRGNAGGQVAGGAAAG